MSETIRLLKGNRGTGRTVRMLRAAIDAALAKPNSPVLVLASSRSHAVQLLHALWEEVPGNSHYDMQTDRTTLQNGSWITVKVNDAESLRSAPRAQLFVDHFTEEEVALRALDEMYRRLAHITRK